MSLFAPRSSVFSVSDGVFLVGDSASLCDMFPFATSRMVRIVLSFTTDGVLWPDFREAEFKQALEWYASRERRFGHTSEQLMEEETNA